MKTAMASALITALALASLPARATTTNLLHDGSFEDIPVASGSWTTVYAKKAIGDDWQTSSSGYEIRSDVAGHAEDGRVFVELDTDRNSAIWQTVMTTAGTAYDLSFWFAPRENVSAESNKIEVLWNGSIVDTVTGDGYKSSDWTEIKTLRLFGTGELGTLTFRAAGQSDSYGGAIDNVSLTATVPEPETCAMLLAGLGLMGMVARRRKTTRE